MGIMTYPHTIAGCCRELLDRTGPRSLADLTAHAVEAGRTQARYPELSVASSLRGDSAVLPLDGDRFASLTTVLDGLVFTTTVCDRLDEEWDLARGVDLAPLRLARVDDPAPPELPDGAWLVAHRYGAGQITAEPVRREQFGDATDFVDTVRRRYEARSVWSRRWQHEVLRVAFDEGWLRKPVAPLSELFPEFVPRPPEPPIQRRRVCPSCDGTGEEPSWSSRFRDDRYGSDAFEPGLPDGWRRRIERLEEATFGY